jgi:hypothetical protein
VALRGTQRAGAGPLPEWLPLSRRLQAAFESRITALPARTRHVLLLVALDGTGRLRTLQSAAPGPYGIDDLAPAERTGLVRVSQDGNRVGGVPAPADPLGGGGAVHRRAAPPRSCSAGPAAGR